MKMERETFSFFDYVFKEKKDFFSLSFNATIYYRVGGSVKKLLTLVKDADIKVKSTMIEFLAPEKIWLSIKEEDKILLTQKKVQKGEILFERNQKRYYSPVSGTVKNIMKRKNCFGKETSFLQIVNDYKENDCYEGVEGTTTILSNNFKKNILDYDGYDWNVLKGQKNIHLNGIENEPYMANKPFLHKYYKDEILMMIDAIAEVLEIENIKLYVTENDRESIEAFQNVLNTYPKIEMIILPDLYPLGEEYVLRKYLKLNDKEPILSTETILDFYHEIVKRRRKDFLFVTITGDAILNPQVVKVKIGTSLKEVVEECIKFSTLEYVLYVNGLMHGIPSKLDWVVLDETIRAVYFMKEMDKQELPCENCGRCNEVCPVKCNPYKSVLTKGKYIPQDCLHCGLCTFICPSYITLEKYLQGEKL